MVALQLPWPAAVPVHCFDRSKPPSLYTMKHAALPLSRRAVNIALSVLAATPKDTLVVAWPLTTSSPGPGRGLRDQRRRSDGQRLRPLLRFDVNDPSKLYGCGQVLDRLGRRQDLQLRDSSPASSLPAGNPLTAEDVVFSLQRAVLLDKTPAFILTQFGLNKDNVRMRQGHWSRSP
jgi:hypothetical protein